MAEVFREIKKHGLPYKCQVGEKCKKIINWCLQFDPKKRPTAVELLNHIASAATPSIKEERAPSQSVRVSGVSDHAEFKVKMQQKMQEIR